MSLSELCANLISPRGENKEYLDKNVIDFITAPWGLAMGCNSDVPALYPAQRFIIKSYYGLELDNSANRDIIVNDQFNEVELYRFNEQEYMMFLFNEGRINRLYEQGQMYPNMVLVCGRRSGKCLTGDTLINTGRGFIEIQKLGNPDGPEYQPLIETVVQEMGKRSSSAYFYNGGVRKTIRVVSYCGFEEEGTPNHRIKVMSEEGIIQWRYLEDIKIGDYIGINRKTDLWPIENISLKKFHENLVLENKVNIKEYNLPNIIDENWATLLGVLVGDGTWGNENGIQVTVGPYPEWLEKVKDIFEKSVGTPSVNCYRKNRYYRVCYYSMLLRSFLDKIGYNLDAKSDNKRIPWVIMQSPKRVVAAFLKGLFETDGCFEGNRVISFSTASKRLAQEVQLLLLNFGIVCRIRYRTNKKYNKVYCHINIIGSNSMNIFNKEIGFLSDRKQSLLNEYILKGYQGNKSSTESIPNQKEWCRKLRDSVPNGQFNINGKGSGDRHRTRIKDALGNVIKNCNEQMTYPRLKNVLDKVKDANADILLINHFEEIYNANYYWDKVVSTESGECKVYDLNVPDGESFVANGMTNHNSTITSCIIAYEVYKLLNKYCPQEYYGIMPEDTIKVTCISTSKDTASELFTKIVGHIERSEFFRKYRRKPTQQYVYLHTQRDLDKYGPKGLASINIRVAPCSAKGLRGPGNIVVALDEMAFFFADEKGGGVTSNKDRDDGAIYKAATPSVAKFKKPDGTPDGKIICLSSPGPMTGKFFKEYERSFEEENEDLFMMQAPTWEVDPDLSTQFLKNSYSANPITFKSEYGAQFSDRMFGWLDDPEIVRRNVIPGLKIKDRSMQRVPHFMGVDLGLKKDGTAITIGHWIQELVEGVKVDKLEIDYYGIRFAKDEGKEYFEPEEMVDWIASFTKKFYIAKGLFDQYYDMTMEPKLHRLGLKQFEARHFNDSLNSSVYQMLLSCLLSRILRIPEGDEVFVKGIRSTDSILVTELLTLQAQQKSKYIVQVAAPEREGEHDDLSDSLARMVYIAHEYRNKSFTHNIAGSAAVGHLRMARMLRKSEMSKFSLNRPSSRFSGMSSGNRFSR
jgi:intein/homing endonuclease